MAIAIIVDPGGIIEGDMVLGDMGLVGIEGIGRMVRKRSRPRILMMGQMGRLCGLSQGIFSWKLGEKNNW
jgi:hypothetical protein